MGIKLCNSENKYLMKSKIFKSLVSNISIDKGLRQYYILIIKIKRKIYVTWFYQTCTNNFIYQTKNYINCRLYCFPKVKTINLSLKDLPIIILNNHFIKTGKWFMILQVQAVQNVYYLWRIFRNTILTLPYKHVCVSLIYNCYMIQLCLQETLTLYYFWEIRINILMNAECNNKIKYLKNVIKF